MGKDKRGRCEGSLFSSIKTGKMLWKRKITPRQAINLSKMRIQVDFQYYMSTFGNILYIFTYLNKYFNNHPLK